MGPWGPPVYSSVPRVWTQNEASGVERKYAGNLNQPPQAAAAQQQEAETQAEARRGAAADAAAARFEQACRSAEDATRLALQKAADAEVCAEEGMRAEEGNAPHSQHSLCSTLFLSFWRSVPDPCHGLVEGLCGPFQLSKGERRNSPKQHPRSSF